MEVIFRSLIYIFILILIILTPTNGDKGPVSGSSKPIENLKDPEVVTAAKFAITEHNKKANTKLVFVDVVKGEEQIVQGSMYRLVISAKDGPFKPNSYYLAQQYFHQNETKIS
ncbi:hypothetical protein DH2020_019159 [Rehmannia glutinosa]|uniref:Cystatin domain-containing protein n=1 Tax=Rehmannia glutinosa TaxID=99300 RepID=A0ABR0WL41_REHGL